MMGKSETDKRLVYTRGYEVNGVSPFAHYYEEIYGHSQGILNIGPRGDKNYFWYSVSGIGGAYYELSEQAKSAHSTFVFFKDKRRQRKYLLDINRLMEGVRSWIQLVETLPLERLTTKILYEYFNKSWLLDARVFSYYLISQPYRLQEIEDSVRSELKKRVAKSKIDYYLSRLIASGEVTLTAEEELAWLKLIVFAKERNIKIKNADSLTNKYPSLRDKILNHYEKYKILNLGDGNWKFNPNGEIKRFTNDYKEPLTSIRKRIAEIKELPKTINLERKLLIKELYLGKDTISTINFLAKLSHSRYSLRVGGFIPLIYATDRLTDELAIRTRYKKFGDILFQSPEELKKSVEMESQHLTSNHIKKRRGSKDEYMIRLNNGKVEYIYGAKAGALFRKLLPLSNQSKTLELTGVVAEPGTIRGAVTVFKWGDDIDKKLKDIKKHPILVAGQTRPAMMPIIRKAKGIVTDEGGVTSHAAIIARELGIPTIINTKNATKIFKEGDLVELDTESGIVRKIQ